ncbi:hypothetical protein PybrP1_005805 [[Pythium] brassicae (nom. inval.)]|nr:hypothetical protein PybrP1_005805 [[Pythium] brassicae (nom. inval.)]
MTTTACNQYESARAGASGLCFSLRSPPFALLARTAIATVLPSELAAPMNASSLASQRSEAKRKTSPTASFHDLLQLAPEDASGFGNGATVHQCPAPNCGRQFTRNPNATPTAASVKRPKRSPTGADDWSRSSSNANDDEDEDEDVEEEEDDEDDDIGAEGQGWLRDDGKSQHERDLPRWPRADAIKMELGMQLGEMNITSLHNTIGGYEEELKPDGIFDSLSSLLEDTDIGKQHTKRFVSAAADAEGTPRAVVNLFDDIIRFHVEDLGGYHATVK